MRYHFAILLFVVTIAASAQQRVADSLAVVIETLPDDTTKVIRLNDLVTRYQYVNASKAAAVVEQSMELAAKLKYALGLATAYRLRGVLYIDRSILDSGKLFYDKAYKLIGSKKEHAFRKQIGLLTHNYGVIHHHRQAYDSATTYYLSAAGIYREIGEDGLLYFPYMNLVTIHSFLKDNKKALQYAMGAYEAARTLSDPGKLIMAVNAEMSIRLELGQYDSVLLPLKNNLAVATRLENHYATGKAANLIAQYFGDGRNRYDSALYYRKIALRMMQTLNNQYEIAGMFQNLGYDYKQIGHYDSAVHYLSKATVLARSLGLDQVVHYSISNLVDAEEKRGNVGKAFAYLKEYLVVNDSLLARNNREHVYELEAKYETAKNAIHIKQLEATGKLQEMSIRQKNIVNYLILAGAIILVIVFFLSYRNYRQKQRLQQQRINELEFEKQLTAAEAVLKGEEQERTRLAKDLHDGLGGMLSGMKYSLNMMKGNLIMTAENQHAFERSMDMLDSSIMEMRRVAHNMMPEALVRFGLDAALRDFCNDINKSGALDITYQSYGLAEENLDQTISITLYRIVQELISNSIRHSSSRTALVQVTRTGEHLSVTVEDEGTGFDTSILNKSRGIGWTNIQHRVEFLKGKLDVNSEPGKGTSVHIEFNV
jgi:two-component system, NarL family, sensor kinase